MRKERMREMRSTNSTCLWKVVQKSKLYGTVSLTPDAAQHNSPAKIASEGGGQMLSYYNIMLICANSVIRN